jgi:Mn2+/Fe2+ NRAMP family transporter
MNSRSDGLVLEGRLGTLAAPGGLPSRSKTLFRGSRLARFAAVAGPGMVVMLADTDAGSVITAAQSGALWVYRLLMLQVILIPILWIIQELTVRLGIVTGTGHGDLIQAHFGRAWAWVSVGTLIIACAGALLTELSGLAGVGSLFGIPAWLTMLIVITGLAVMVFTGSYLSVERIAIAVGAFELVFLIVAWNAHPNVAEMVHGAVSIPWRNSSYLYLVSANIGAVIMPWMVFYQQSSVVEKRLTVADLPSARWDTAIGSVVTQVIMAAILIVTAATLGKSHAGASLDTVQDIAQGITPFLGKGTGELLFAMGMTGAALVATIVVTLTAARSIGEILGVNHRLEQSPKEAPWFYGTYLLVLILGGLVVMSGMDLVKLSVAVQVMNTLLLPVVLGFLYLLARRLPEPHRLKGAYAAVVAIVILVTVAFGLYTSVVGMK